MGRFSIGVLGLFAILGLALLCSHCHRGGIEEDLTSRAEKGLEEAGFVNLKLAAEGRDLTLGGVIASDQDRRGALAAAEVYGVRVVLDQLELGTSAAVRASDVSGESPGADSDQGSDWRLTAAREASGALAWRGTLTAADLERLTVASASYFEESGQRSEDVVAGQTPLGPEAAALIHGVLPYLASLEGAELEATPGRFRLVATPKSLQEAKTVRAALGALTPPNMDLELVWRRDWRPEELALEATARDGGWILSGLVPDGSRQTWLGRAGDAGLEPLQDHLIEADIDAPDGFGEAFSAALGSLDSLGGARLVESNGRLDISGHADESKAKELEVSLRPQLPGGVDLAVAVAPKLERTACQGVLKDELSEEKIQFASGSAAIDARSDGLIRRLSRILRRCPGSSVTIEGHTDSDGAADFNQKLSQRRAGAVLRRLLALGVDPSRLEAAGFGEERPLAEGDSAQAKQQNRRIEFRLHEDA